MNGLMTVARMTFLDAVRSRVLWSILFFCCVLIFGSFVFQELTIAAFDRVVRDVGLAAVDAFGVIIALFLGVSSIVKELDRRSIYNILSKPIPRSHYLIGKLLGSWLVVVLCLCLMAAAVVLETLVYRGPVRAVIFQAVWLILVEQLVILSFSLFMSVVTEPAVAGLATVTFYVLGHLSKDLYFFVLNARSLSPGMKSIGKAIFFFLPNLERLNLKSDASVLRDVASSVVLAASGYGVVYAATFIFLAAAVFQFRDLR